MPCQTVGRGLRRHRGVTPIELLVAVMIVSILAAVAVPSCRAYADTATLTAAGYADVLAFPAGAFGVTTADVTVCFGNPDGAQERHVSIAASGRASISKTTAGSCP